VADVISTVNALPPAIKAGWVIWLAWAAAQVMWYRRARVAAPAVKPATPPVARRRPESRPEPRPESRLETRPEPRPVRREAKPASSPAAADVSLPSIDLSDIVAAAERSSARDAGTPHPSGIPGLE
jgi:hypothetical protein